MPATKAYTRVNFENYPSTNTPLNATNLNKVDKGIDDLDDLLVTARNNIETLQSNATTDEANILALQGSVAALNGFTYYPAGEVNLVALVADDSFYKDANDKYVLADSAAGQALIDGVTYKALASTEDTRGEVGADAVSPFSKGFELIPKVTKVDTSIWMYNGTSVALDTDKEYCFLSVGNGALSGSIINIKNYISIQGNYESLLVNEYTTHSQYCFGANYTFLLKKKKGENVTIRFSGLPNEKNSPCAIVTEF